MERVSAALDAGDVDAFVAQWTDDGLEQVFGQTTATFATQTGYYVEAIQWSLGPAADTVVTGTTATTVAPLFFRMVGAPRRFSLVNDGAAWKIDGADLATVDAPDDQLAGVTIAGSAIGVEPGSIQDRTRALEVRNATTNVHELMIMSVPMTFDISAFFAHPELGSELPEGQSMPDGTDFVGGVNAIEPGTTVTMLLRQGLQSGRYVLFCNVEDSAGVPHAEQGEYADFTVR